MTSTQEVNASGAWLDLPFNACVRVYITVECCSPSEIDGNRGLYSHVASGQMGGPKKESILSFKLAVELRKLAKH